MPSQPERPNPNGVPRHPRPFIEDVDDRLRDLILCQPDVTHRLRCLRGEITAADQLPTLVDGYLTGCVNRALSRGHNDLREPRVEQQPLWGGMFDCANFSNSLAACDADDARSVADVPLSANPTAPSTEVVKVGLKSYGDWAA